MSNLKKLSCILLSIIMVSANLVCMIPNVFAQNQQNNKITIYHTNDVHGKAQSKYSPEGVLTQIGFDMIKSMKDSSPNSLLLDSGDSTQGSTLATYSKGANIIKLMNATGYDAAAIGNHEFDYGREQLIENVKSANFPIISANMYSEQTNEPLLKDINGNNGCNIIKDVNGKKIGIFSVLTDETMYKTKPDNVEGCKIQDTIDTAKSQVEYLKSQGVDFIICLAHIGIDASSKITSIDIANKVDGINLMLDGHSHSVNNQIVNGTTIQQIGTGSKNVGKVEVEINDGNPSINCSILDATNVGKNYDANPEVTNLFDSLYDELRPKIERVIGKTATKLFGGSYEGQSISRAGETNLADLVCDSMMWGAKELLKDNSEAKDMDVVVLQNGGGIRSSIEAGYITIDDVESVLPDGNCISIKKITPNDLYNILENGVSKLKAPKSKGAATEGHDGRFCQVAGMRLEYDMTQKAYNSDSTENENGERIQKVVLLNSDGTDKKVLDRDDTESKIAFVSNAFENAGGDGYVILKKYPSLAEGNVLSDVLASYVTKLTLDNGREFKYPFNQNRVTSIKSDDLYGNYDAKVNILEESVVVAEKEIDVSVDDCSFVKMITDSEGKIIVKDLSSGMHNIRIIYNGKVQDVYVNECLKITSVTAVLENKSQKNIDGTISVISQIGTGESEKDKPMITFARTSYDSLTKQEQAKVINYNELQKAERKLSGINNPLSFIQDSPLTLIVIILSIGAVVVVVFIVRKRVLKK